MCALFGDYLNGGASEAGFKETASGSPFSAGRSRMPRLRRRFVSSNICVLVNDGGAEEYRQFDPSHTDFLASADYAR